MGRKKKAKEEACISFCLLASERRKPSPQDPRRFGWSVKVKDRGFPRAEGKEPYGIKDVYCIKVLGTDFTGL